MQFQEKWTLLKNKPWLLEETGDEKRKTSIFFIIKTTVLQFILEAKLLEGAQSFIFCWQVVTE